MTSSGLAAITDVVNPPLAEPEENEEEEEGWRVTRFRTFLWPDILQNLVTKFSNSGHSVEDEEMDEDNEEDEKDESSEEEKEDESSEDESDDEGEEEEKMDTDEGKDYFNSWMDVNFQELSIKWSNPWIKDKSESSIPNWGRKSRRLWR